MLKFRIDRYITDNIMKTDFMFLTETWSDKELIFQVSRHLSLFCGSNPWIVLKYENQFIFDKNHFSIF
jgi:hypothetical protein